MVFSVLLLTVFFVSGAATAGQHQESECDEAGYDIDCNALGSIRMPSTQGIDGEPESITASIWLNSDMEDEDVRWWLFKIDSEHGGEAVHARVDAFGTHDATILTTRESTDGPVEQEFWVDVVDLPVQEEILIEMTVGSVEVGAYPVEVHVIPFDRGYENVYDEEGDSYDLYASTTLSVTEATDPFGEEGQAAWLNLVKDVPGTGAIMAALAVFITAVAWGRRGS